MIQKNRAQRISYFLGNLLDSVISPIMIGFGSITSVGSSVSQNWPPIFVDVIDWCKTYSLPIWITLGLLTIFGWVLRRRGDPWVWDKLQILLDRFQEVAYRQFPNHIKDDHRVTLFKYQRLHYKVYHPLSDGRLPWKKDRLPWNGWLIPVLRSGKTSQKTQAVFMVPDNGNQAEGVAGLAWASNSVVVADSLIVPGPTSSDTTITRYAKRTNCPELVVRDYIRKGRHLPASIAAIPIEVNNVHWGVLVLDSRHGNGVSGQLVENFTLIVQSISQLLERANELFK